MTFEDDDPLRPFDMPTEGPQLDWEQTAPIRVLIENAPQWDDSFLPELLHLARTHVAVRAVIAFSMEVARHSELSLRHATDPIEIYRAQGNVQGLEKFYMTVLSELENIEQQKDKTDELS